MDAPGLIHTHRSRHYGACARTVESVGWLPDQRAAAVKSPDLHVARMLVRLLEGSAHAVDHRIKARNGLTRGAGTRRCRASAVIPGANAFWRAHAGCRARMRRPGLDEVDRPP